VVLGSFTEPQSGKSMTLDVAAHSFHANPPAKPHAAWQFQPSPSRTILFLATVLSSRAPPAV
jgi:hypothetical protein